MEIYIGMDVSLKETSICVVDGKGEIVSEGTVSSEPAAIAKFIESKAGNAKRIGLETGPTTTWLWHELRALGLAVMEHEDSVLAAFDEEELQITTCPLTDERMFGAALTAILNDPDFARAVEAIEVVREWPEAVIRYRADGELCESRWVCHAAKGLENRARLPGALRSYAVIGGAIIHQMSIDLADEETAEWTSKIDAENPA